MAFSTRCDRSACGLHDEASIAVADDSAHEMWRVHNCYDGSLEVTVPRQHRRM